MHRLLIIYNVITMNENLNLVEILKNCPKGTKLYSIIFGEVELDHIECRANYQID